LWHAFVEEKHAVSEEDAELVIQDMKLDAEGLSLELNSSPDFAIPSEPTVETEIKPLKQAIATSDRVIDFKNPAEREK
jgi:hypothetical protein